MIKFDFNTSLMEEFHISEGSLPPFSINTKEKCLECPNGDYMFFVRSLYNYNKKMSNK